MSFRNQLHEFIDFLRIPRPQGSGISEENISYLTAECSCLIKDDLPGTDILFINSWENPQLALLNKIIDANPLPGE